MEKLLIISTLILMLTNNCLAIIGGDVVEDRAVFNHQVLLHIITKSRTADTCGGSIIDENHILTAGHCVDDTIPSGITVMAGIIERYVDGGRNYTVSSIHPYEFYKNRPGSPPQYDIAVLKINGPIEFNDDVGQIPIAISPLEIDTECEYAGWGSTEPGRRTPTSVNLRTAQGKILPRGYCVLKGIPLYQYEQCFGRVSQEKSAIMNYGDSGSGFICNKFLTGILVRGRSDVTYPAVFVDVQKFLIFINHVRDNFACASRSAQAT